jgi:predicted dehydrogenase
MTAPLNWGILATGGIARKFAAALPASRTGRLVAVGSRTPAAAEAFAAAHGHIRAHGSYEALLADPAVQAVYIANPHPGHLEWTLKAAAAGKHILCEKPLALNRADAERMIAAARQHRVFLMEAFMYRCHPQTDRLAALVAGGAIGELRAIHANFTVPFKFDPAHRLFAKELGGGAILDLGCYPVSFSRRMAGAANGQVLVEPVSFQATGRLNAVTGVDEFAAATVAYPGGITAQLSCSSCTPLEIRARLLGTTGWIDVPGPFHPGNGDQPATVLLHHNGAPAPEVIRIESAQPLYAVEADTVAASVARGELESPAMSHADTLGNMAVLDGWRAAVGLRYAGEG